MTISIPGSLTGAAQTGFTTPGYTTTADTPPDVNSKQVAITAITGTQAGVDAHSVSRPFTVTTSRPKQFGVLGKPNPTTGLIASVPRNTYKVLTRKGVTPLAGQPSQVCVVRSEVEVPAGSDTSDPANIRAALSAHIGALQAISAGLGDTTINGVL
nr:MAG: hypothetical protein 2 [Leviviridae sp.]